MESDWSQREVLALAAFETTHDYLPCTSLVETSQRGGSNGLCVIAKIVHAL